MKECGVARSCYDHTCDYQIDFDSFARFMSPRGVALMARCWSGSCRSSVRLGALWTLTDAKRRGDVSRRGFPGEARPRSGNSENGSQHYEQAFLRPTKEPNGK